MNDNDIAKAVVENDLSLRAFVSVSIRNSSAVDDVMQEIWKAAVTKIKRYDSSRPFRAWLFGIAKMQVLKWRQSAARNRECLLPEVIDVVAVTALENTDETDYRLSIMKTCLGKLSSSDCEMLNLKYYHGMRLTDIAQKLGKNVAAVEMAATRARRNLKNLMDKAIRVEEQTKTSRYRASL